MTRIVYEETTQLILAVVTDDNLRVSTRHPIVEWDEEDEAAEIERFEAEGANMEEALGLVRIDFAGGADIEEQEVADLETIGGIAAPSSNFNQGRFNNGNGARGFRQRPGNQKDNRPPGLGPP